MECPNCKKMVPDDAVFCPYCGYRLRDELSKYVVLEDLEELKSIASVLNRNYLPKELKCSIDKKGRRLMFSPSFRGAFLVGLAKRSRPAVVSTLTIALEQALKKAEEELGIRFQLDKMSSWTYFVNTPILYYKVMKKLKHQ